MKIYVFNELLVVVAAAAVVVVVFHQFVAYRAFVYMMTMNKKWKWMNECMNVEVKNELANNSQYIITLTLVLFYLLLENSDRCDDDDDDDDRFFGLYYVDVNILFSVSRGEKKRFLFWLKYHQIHKMLVMINQIVTVSCCCCRGSQELSKKKTTINACALTTTHTHKHRPSLSYNQFINKLM